jgi:acyl transferase domain-containing protein/SAM-dependent methyltransferase
MTELLNDIAVIGMSGRFPGAGTLEAFWAGLRGGTEGVRRFTDAELRAGGVSEALLAHPDYVKAGVLLEDIDQFDAEFFRMTPREAAVTDPQHRLFLECVWEALEAAGCDPARFPGAIGVFASAALSGYLGRLIRNPPAHDGGTMFELVLGCDKDFLPLRVAHTFDLHGPALAVQTACSSSLVAVHLACQSLLTCQTDMAIAGGSSIGLMAPAGYLYQRGGILSPDGHCRAFDAAAQGTVGGSGVGVVVLRRLSEALAAGDPVRAVIKGSAVNNDGARKVGYTAPSVAGQAAVIREALAMAGVAAASVSYVEAHGTGTALGDPVEVAALREAFGTGAAVGGCGLGSVKSNIGHLDAAAGVAGLIKTVLSLEAGELAPSLHVTQPHPGIAWATSPFFIPTTAQPWVGRAGGPRRAGVSSFGIGGTNAHVVVEEAPARRAAAASARPWQVLVQSARSAAALAAGQQRLATWLTSPAGLSAALADVAATLQTGRQVFEYRDAVVAATPAGAAAALAGRPGAAAGRRGRPVVFVFPGQGAQRPGMGRQLYATEPAFRAATDACAALLTPWIGGDVRTWWDLPAAELAATARAQPALFVFMYALAQQWRAWGVEPVALLGHSLGEWVAACLAGVFTLADALRLVVERGRRMQALAPGAMAAVGASAAAVGPLLGEAVWLAASNGPAQCVVAGTAAGMAALAGRVQAAGYGWQPLAVSHAFHSGLMAPMVPAFVALVAAVPRTAPRLPYLSNVTGTWVTAAEACDPAYWGAQIRQPVRFGEGVAALEAQLPDAVWLEVGPGRTLQGALQAGAGPGRLVTATLGGGADEPRAVAETVGRLWTAGVDVAWDGWWAGEARTKVRLPGYAFQRQSHWLAVPAGAARGADRTPAADWYYVPSWTRVPLARSGAPPPRRWVVWEGTATAVGAALAARLPGEVVRVAAAADWTHAAPDRFGIDPTSAAHARQVWTALRQRRFTPDHVVHLGGLTPPATLDAGFHSLLALAHALGDCPDQTPLALTIDLVGAGGHSITGDETLALEDAASAAAAAEITRRHPSIACRSIDLTRRPDASAALEIDLLLRELTTGTDTVVAYRGGQRWVREHRPAGDGAGASTLAEHVVVVSGGTTRAVMPLAEAVSARGATVVAIETAAPIGQEPVRLDPGQVAEDVAQQPVPVKTAEHAAFDEALCRLCAARISEWLHRETPPGAPRDHAGALGTVLGVKPNFLGLFEFAWEFERQHARGVLPNADTLKRAIEERFSGWRDRIQQLDRCLQALPQIVREQSSPHAVVFDDDAGSVDTLGFTAAPLYCQALAQSLRRLAERAGRRLRIIEVGGGTGFLTRIAVDALTGLDVHYEFTDIGRGFVGRVQEVCAERGVELVSCKTFDITKDLRQQGFTPASYDVVLALNCVHATPDVRESLRNLRRLLRPGGSLCLIEAASLPEWANFVAGLFPEWWARPDARPARGGILLSPAGWRDQLAASGFEGSVESHRADADDHALIIGRQSSVALSFDEARRLHTIAPRESAADWPAAVLAEVRESFGRLDTVVHIADTADGAGLTPLAAYAESVASWCGAAGEHGADVVLAALATEHGATRDEVWLRSACHDVVGERMLRASHRIISAACAGVDSEGEVRRWAERAGRLIGSGMGLGVTIANGISSPAKVRDHTGDLTDPRRAAPEPEPATADGRGTVAVTVAEIWSEILGVRDLGPDQDFFALGGDSLQGIQVITRLRRRLKVDLPVSALFGAPTLSAFTAVVEGTRPSDPGAADGLLPAAVERPAAIPLSFAQRRIWFLDQLDPGSALLNVPSMFAVKGPLDLAVLDRALGFVAGRHESLRTVYAEEQGAPVQIVRPDSAPPLRVLDAVRDAACPGDPPLRTIEREMLRPFDLAEAPPWRVAVIAEDDENALIAFTFHHVVCDGWSLKVFFSEVAACYGAFRDGREPGLPAQAAQYADYVRWQQRQQADGRLEGQLRYWQAQLTGAPPLALRRDRLPPAAASASGATLSYQLGPELTAEVERLCQERSVTRFMALLAAFEVVIHHHSGQDDFLVGTPVANRSLVETESMIGCFLNVVALRATMDGDLTFDALLGRAREQALGAYANQDVPFELIVERLRPAPSTSVHPLFQVSFSYHNVPPPRLDLPDLEVRAVSVAQGTVRLDLILTIQETAGGMTCNLEYRTDLLEHDTATRLLQDLEHVTRLAVRDPATRLSALERELRAHDRRRQEATLQQLQHASLDRLHRRRDAGIPVIG